MSQTDDILETLEQFKADLKSRATGGYMDEKDYKEYRNILTNSSIKDLLPKFVFTCRSTDDFWSFIQPKYPSYKERRMFLDSEFEKAIYEAEFGSTNKGLEIELNNIKAKFNTDYINSQIQLMYDNVETYPYDSIGKAKELIESCCIEILTETGEDVSKYKDDMTKLATHTLDVLNLRASNVDDAKKGAKEIKKILGSLNQIAVGIAELRNAYGSGHGKDKNFSGLTPRHARLAVGSATNLVNFLWETYEMQKEIK